MREQSVEKLIKLKYRNVIFVNKTWSFNWRFENDFVDDVNNSNWYIKFKQLNSITFRCFTFILVDYSLSHNDDDKLKSLMILYFFFIIHDFLFIISRWRVILRIINNVWKKNQNIINDEKKTLLYYAMRKLRHNLTKNFLFELNFARCNLIFIIVFEIRMHCFVCNK